MRMPHSRRRWRRCQNSVEKRRTSSDRRRTPFPAFEALVDLQDCLSALRILRSALEEELGMDAERSTKRQDALKALPRIAAQAESNYSINDATNMVGRTVAKVEYGFRHAIKGVHQSELLIIHFTDDSIMSLDTGCNAGKRRQPR